MVNLFALRRVRCGRILLRRYRYGWCCRILVRAFGDSDFLGRRNNWVTRNSGRRKEKVGCVYNPLRQCGAVVRGDLRSALATRMTTSKKSLVSGLKCDTDSAVYRRVI